jgi:ElaB/YqjD/DUF883 family membrane-anchored ribosome-binding protein
VVRLYDYRKQDRCDINVTMAKKYLFRSQLNELIAAMSKTSLPMQAFTFSRDLSKNNLDVELPLKISFESSSFHFHLDHIWKSFHIDYLPSDKSKQGHETKIIDSWKEVRKVFESWMQRVQDEVSQPDSWLILNQGNLLEGSFPTGDRGVEQFSQEEVSRLRKQIKLIKEYIQSEVKPSKEQFEQVNEKLNYMQEASERVNKKDWANIAISTTINIAVSLAMNPEKARKLFTFTSEFIKFIFTPLLQ